MINSQINSLANPIGGSSAFSHGTKDGEKFVTYSVGTQLGGAGYLTKNSDNDEVYVTISNGTATFTYPQTHPYIGVGDMFYTGGSLYFLNRKIDPSTWLVTTATGASPTNITNTAVGYITKVFADLNAAIDGSSSGALSLIGNADLTSLSSSVRIALYEMTDAGGSVDVTGWTTDEFHYVRIFVPWDIKKECNSKQRHEGIFGSGYSITNDITLSDDYCEVDGLALDGPGSGDGIDASASTGSKIVNNLVKEYATPVKTGDVNIVVSNILFDATLGIDDTANDSSIMINNTLVDCVTGISGGANTESWNNLIQGATTGLTGLGGGNITNTITNDATGDIPSETILFRDSTSNDFHLDFHSKTGTADPITGGDNSVTALFPFDRDIDTELVSGNGWPIGADRFVPNPHYSIGKDTSDIQSGGTLTKIEDGLATFSTAQSHATLCAGCVMDIGGTNYYLYKKVSSTEWQVTDGTGLAPADLVVGGGPYTIVSIKYAFNSIHAAIDGDGSPGVETPLTSLDLPTLGSRVTIACTEGSLYIGAEVDSGFTTDENHFIKIYTPNTPGTDCNETRRHSGIYSSDYCLASGIGDVNNALELTTDYCVVDGLQLRGDGSGIKVSAGTNMTITNNIIFSTHDDAIVFDTADGGGFNTVVNNIIYDSVNDGIKILHNGSLTERNTFYVYNNTVHGCDEGFYFEIKTELEHTNTIYFYNNLIQNSTTRDCYCTTGASRFLFSKSNYSSDRSLGSFRGTNDSEAWDAVFKDAERKDFRITMYESRRMIYALNLTADPNYPFTTDIAGDSRNTYKWIPTANSYIWSSGAYNWTPVDYELHYSIGDETDNLDTESGRTISITNSILTFIGGSVDNSIGVGDKVIYTGGSCYLAERGNNSTWLVRSYNGALIGDVSTVGGVAVNRVSNSLNAAFDGGEFYTEHNTSYGLSSNFYVWCYDDGTDDTGDVTIDSWGTSSTAKIIISSPWDTNTQAGSSQRHVGYWSTSGFTVDATGATCIDIDLDYVDIEGLKVTPLNTSSNAIVVKTLKSNCNIFGNLVKDAAIGIEAKSGATSINAAGNVVYDTTTSAIDIPDGSILNNTLVGTTGNGAVVNTNTVIWNNLISGFTTDISETGSPASTKLNITSDATAGTTYGNKSNVTINFRDSSSDDYRIRRDDIMAFGQGADLTNNDYYPFKYGIDMNLSSGLWSIGADVAPDFDAIDLYFSVSKYTSDMKEDISTAITISNGIATFSEAQTDDRIGIGDEVIYASGTCYLYNRTSQTVWTVVDKYGLTPDDVASESVTSIKHTFDELNDAVYGTGNDGIREFLGDSNNPFENFVAAKYRVHLPVYKHTVYHTTKVTIKGYVTNDDYYLRVYAPHDVDNECNSRQRHEGNITTSSPGSQSLINYNGSDESVLIESDNITFDGIIIKSQAGTDDGVRLNECIGSKVTGNLITNTDDGIQNDGGQYFFDDFNDGTIDANWNIEFTTNWSVRQVNPDGNTRDKYIATQDSPYTYQRLTNDCQDDIDFEFGIYIDEQDTSEVDSFKIQINDVATDAQQFEVSYEVDGSGNHSIGFDGANFLLADAVPGRVYRLRITRGRTISPDGARSVSDTTDDLRLYYFDDFSEGNGTGTNKWIIHPDISTESYSGDIYLEMIGASRHGISYIKGWAEAGAFIADLADGPGYLVSSNIANNIIYRVAGHGVDCGGLDYVYNNTVLIAGGYAYNNSATDTLINNINRSSSSGGFVTSTGVSYCVTSDSSAGSSNNNREYDVSFVSQTSGSEDLHLHFDDIGVRGKGKRLLSDSYFAFDYDSSVEDRGRLWDVGALEYVPENIVCYSVGRYTQNIASTGGTGLVGYSVSTDSLGRSIMTFDLPQTNDRMGVGNEVIDATNITDGCIILEKIDTSNWVVTDFEGANLPTISSGVASRINRTFDSLSEALNKTTGIFSSGYANTSDDLTTAKTQVRVACYDDRDEDLDYDDVYLNTLTSDPDYFLRIFAPNDFNKEINASQRHAGKFYGTGFGDGYVLQPSSGLGTDYAMRINLSDFIEIEGLVIKLDNSSTSHYYDKESLNIQNSNNVFISSNILTGEGNGVNLESISGTYSNDQDVIINNVVYDCLGDGIRFGSSSALTNSRVILYNNTIVDCRRSTYFIHPSSGNSVFAEIKNNIGQGSTLRDFVEEYPDYDTSNYYNNISSDESLSIFTGSSNIINTTITFYDRSEDFFDLDDTDVKPLDGALDLSEDDYYPFLLDVVSRTRESELWDIGAFELVEAEGEGTPSIGPLIVSGVPFATNTPPTFPLYLREDLTTDLITSVDSTYQFETITALNTFLSTNASIYDGFNLIIYVHGGKSFEGSFEFNDKGTRTVSIKTLAEEADIDGPGSIIYNGPVIDDSSLMSKLTFDGVKVYSDDAATNDYLLNNTYAGDLEIELINAIVQVNKDSVIGNTTGDCFVNSYNSIVIYKNGDSSSDLYLNMNSLSGNLIVNSMILSFLDSNLSFTTTNTQTDDNVVNCLTYNYGSGILSFGNSSSRVISPKQDTNPSFLEAELTSGFTPSVLMVNEFKPKISSLAIDAGENSYVDGTILYDIVNNDRIYDFKIVDIGPYELEVHNMSFTSENLSSIHQDKLNLDFSTRYYNSRFEGTVYRNLYNQFTDNTDYRVEFTRESKIIFRMKEDLSEYRTFTDKKNTEIHTFEAYYDSGSRSIVINKESELFDGLFSNILKDGRYVFYFSEVGHYLKVYLNETYEKGLSGTRNVVKNVKFGGPSIASN